MSGLEPKKLALLRIYQILKEHSDCDHPLTQEEILTRLDEDYGIVIERKAVGRNLSLLKDADIDIGSCKAGSYLIDRDFDDSELHMLIDGVLNSKYISAEHSKDLIEKICGLSNKYFRASVKNIYSVNDWNKTDNKNLFWSISIIDQAIKEGRQIRYQYNKYGVDKKLHPSSIHTVSPIHMVLKNQRYYLMAYHEKHKVVVFHRLDHITEIEALKDSLTPIRNVPGYENGVDYKELSSAHPYMFSDKPQRATFIANKAIIDEVIEWFGNGVKFTTIDGDDNHIKVDVKVSLDAMEYWALQFLNYVEVISPVGLRNKIGNDLGRGFGKYSINK